ncbi:MAG: hypothetical protein GX147_00715 [Deltaproteobacteria bacterium]|nr:hypothetical protein [Deltaproteobacteria bacterium]
MDFHDISPWRVIAWILIVLVAAFIGQFGKSFAQHLMSRFRRKKTGGRTAVSLSTDERADVSPSTEGRAMASSSTDGRATVSPNTEEQVQALAATEAALKAKKKEEKNRLKIKKKEDKARLKAMKAAEKSGS